jgi:hypothetical protein
MIKTVVSLACKNCDSVFINAVAVLFLKVPQREIRSAVEQSSARVVVI